MWLIHLYLTVQKVQVMFNYSIGECRIKTFLQSVPDFLSFHSFFIND